MFVRDKDYLKAGAPKVFHVRKVRLGAKDGKNTEIIAGVLPGELVVDQGERPSPDRIAAGQPRRRLCVPQQEVTRVDPC